MSINPTRSNKIVNHCVAIFALQQSGNVLFLWSKTLKNFIIFTNPSFEPLLVRTYNVHTIFPLLSLDVFTKIGFFWNPSTLFCSTAHRFRIITMTSKVTKVSIMGLLKILSTSTRSKHRLVIKRAQT